MFQLSPQIRSNVKHFQDRTRLHENETVVGFHIRRGDYREYWGGERFVDDETWRHWIDEARKVFDAPSRPFRGILFSNENVDAILDGAKDLGHGPGGMYEDLEMLSRCDYILAPQSTFSGWASFIGNVPIQEIGNERKPLAPDTMKPLAW